MGEDSDFQTRWTLSEEDFAWLWEEIHNPPPPNEYLKKAMRAKRVWESDSDYSARCARCGWSTPA